MLRLAFCLSLVVLGLTQANGAAAVRAGLEPGLIAFVQGHVSGLPLEIHVMNPDGSGERFLANGYAPRWSPDGTRVAFYGKDEQGLEGLYLINRDGSGLRRLATGASVDHAWSPDGREIAFHSFASSFWSNGLVVIDVESGRIRQLTRNVNDANPTWSPRGGRIAFVRSIRRVATVNADGSGLRLLTPRKFDALSPEWSPDGRRIVFQMRTDPSKSDIWVMNGDGTHLRNLTHSDDLIDGFPQWSPSGLRIAFVSFKRRPPKLARHQDIHAMRRDGSADRNLTASARYESSPAWSPDGRRFVFAGVNLEGVNGGDPWDIYVMSSDGRSVINLTNNPVGTKSTGPVWSP